MYFLVTAVFNKIITESTLVKHLSLKRPGVGGGIKNEADRQQHKLHTEKDLLNQRNRKQKSIQYPKTSFFLWKCITELYVM